MAIQARRALILRGLTAVGVGIVLAVGAAAPMAVADDTQDGDGQVTVSVTISKLDPCAAGAPSCLHGGGAELAMTGATVGVPLGVGLLLTAAGIGAVAVQRRRRLHA